MPRHTTYIGPLIKDLREVKHGDAVIIATQNTTIFIGTVDGSAWSSTGSGTPDSIRVNGRNPRTPKAPIREVDFDLSDGKTVHKDTER